MGYAPETTVKSAGTGGHFAGNPASSEMRAAAKSKAQVDLASHRAKQVQASDFEDFDFVLAMDSENFADLKRICPKRHEGKVQLLLPTYAPELKMQDTPDPYFVGGYEGVVEAVETAVKGLI